MKNIQDAEVSGKKVLIRADFNVGLENEDVKEKFKIAACKNTVEHLIASGADKIALMSHLGRPDGKRDEEYSLLQIRDDIENILGIKVVFCEDCIGERVAQALEELPLGSVLLLENVRFYPEEEINDGEFAKKLGLNKMTASRALNDLYNLNLIKYQIGGRTGRSKEYKRISDPDYFLIGREYLKTPVRRIIYAESKPLGALTAGLDALAVLSMINPLGHSIVAIEKNKLDENQIEIVKNKDFIKDKKLVEIELWDYDPRLFSNSSNVDILSLYASLKDETDERVEQALEDVLRGELWYTD